MSHSDSQVGGAAFSTSTHHRATVPFANTTSSASKSTATPTRPLLVTVGEAIVGRCTRTANAVKFVVAVPVAVKN